MVYTSPLRYIPIEPEIKRAIQGIDIGISYPVFSLQMLRPREVQFVKNKLTKLLTGTRYNFDIRGSLIYLISR